MPESSETTTAPAIIVIFGITGDLAQRKLLPALYHLMKEDLLDERTVILGVTRRAVTVDELLGQVELCVNEIDKVCDPASLRKVHKALRMFQMSLVDGGEYDELLAVMNGIEAEQGVCMSRLYYLATPPKMFETIVPNMGKHGFNNSCPHGTAASRLLVEKPFGYDLASAQNLIAKTGEWFNEDQLFRIDHYLAKETVQNILEFRMTHPLVAEIWNNQHIGSVVITAYEKIDIEGRAVFYEPVGALRDFIQSHLIQLLAVVTMPLPESLDSENVHPAKLQLLQAIVPVRSEDVASKTRRGQYQGYTDEVSAPDSHTETYAEVHLHIDSPTWSGVPITLRTGKALADKRTNVAVTFRNVSDDTSQNELIFRIQPNAGLMLKPSGEQPDFTDTLKKLVSEFNASHHFDTTIPEHPDAYERVLVDAVRGDHTLFTTSEEVIAAWVIVDDIVKVWAESADGLIIYPKGAASIG